MKRIILFLSVMGLFLVTGSCKKRGDYRHCCPPVKGAGGKWQLIEATDENGQDILDSLKQKSGGNIILEFVKRDGKCYVHTYVKETGGAIYENTNQEPIIEYTKCQISPTPIPFSNKDHYQKQLRCYLPSLRPKVKTLLPYIAPYYFYDTTRNNVVELPDWIVKISWKKEGDQKRLYFDKDIIPEGDCLIRNYPNNGRLVFKKIK